MTLYSPMTPDQLRLIHEELAKITNFMITPQLTAPLTEDHIPALRSQLAAARGWTMVLNDKLSDVQLLIGRIYAANTPQQSTVSVGPPKRLSIDDLASLI